MTATLQTSTPSKTRSGSLIRAHLRSHILLTAARTTRQIGRRTASCAAGVARLPGRVKGGSAHCKYHLSCTVRYRYFRLYSCCCNEGSPCRSLIARTARNRRYPRITIRQKKATSASASLCRRLRAQSPTRRPTDPLSAAQKCNPPPLHFPATNPRHPQ